MELDGIGFIIGCAIGSLIAFDTLYKASEEAELDEPTPRVIGRALRYMVSPSYYAGVLTGIYNKFIKEVIYGFKGK